MPTHQSMQNRFILVSVRLVAGVSVRVPPPVRRGEHTVSPVCTHLGGIVNWNDVDEAWECPLHGSRFAPDGTMLEGPATRDLTRSQ